MAHQADHTVLGGGVGDAGGAGSEGGLGGHGHDGTPAGLLHEGEDGPGQAHDPGEVDPQDPFPGGVVDLGHGEEVVHDPGHVGEDVDPSLRRCHDPVHVGLPADVGGHGPVLAGPRHLAHGLGQALLVEVAGDDAGPLGGEPPGGGAPDSRSGPGDDHRLPRMSGGIHVPSWSAARQG